MRRRADQNEQRCHQQQFPSGVAPQRFRALYGYQRDDPAETGWDRRIGDRDKETGHEQRRYRARDLPHEMPVEAEQRIWAVEHRRRRFGRRLGGFEQAFEKAEHEWLNAYRPNQGQWLPGRPWRARLTQLGEIL